MRDVPAARAPIQSIRMTAAPMLPIFSSDIQPCQRLAVVAGRRGRGLAALLVRLQSKSRLQHNDVHWPATCKPIIHGAAMADLYGTPSRKVARDGKPSA